MVYIMLACRSISTHSHLSTLFTLSNIVQYMLYKCACCTICWYKLYRCTIYAHIIVHKTHINCTYGRALAEHTAPAIKMGNMHWWVRCIICVTQITDYDKKQIESGHSHAWFISWKVEPSKHGYPLGLPRFYSSLYDAYQMSIMLGVTWPTDTQINR